MPKIDVSTIDGYADMSVEDKLAALEGFEYDDNSEELSKYKNAVSKANSEAAEYKHQLQDANQKIADAQAASDENLTETEKQLAEMKKQVATLQHDKTVSEFTAKFTGLGFDADNASTAAIAYADGKTDDFFDCLKSFLASHDKAMKAELAQHSIAPNAGNTNPDKKKTMSKAKFHKLTPLQRAQIAQNDPELFAEMTKN